MTTKVKVNGVEYTRDEEIRTDPLKKRVLGGDWYDEEGDYRPNAGRFLDRIAELEEENECLKRKLLSIYGH